MIEFLLNNNHIRTDKPASMALLDFIRYDENLRGTKIGCREGDCGACTILIGSIKKGKLQYMSATSCLTPLLNVHGKHVVTVEGMSFSDKLNRAQAAMVENSGTQCGFCTPGFVTSLCGYALTCGKSDLESAIGSVDGNICRCTGYKSIERAATKLSKELSQKDQSNPLVWLVDNDFVPDYFLGIEQRLKEIKSEGNPTGGQIPIGGGTDLFVQKHDDLQEYDLNYLFDREQLNGISFDENHFIIKAEVPVSDLINNQTLLEVIPNWYQYLKLISSTPIRNIATIAGNIANASPIGDFSIILLALKANVELTNKENLTRQVPLRDFYLGYKVLNKTADEIISAITFELPKTKKFNFEKVSKRQHLDIASVNSAFSIAVENNTILEVDCSFGGVGPIPTYLTKTCEFLIGKSITAETVLQAEQILNSEISPISDARGTIEYKRLLARQLFFSHFITLFPQQIIMQELV